ncbi:MAG: hypothetical protein KF696_07715 [Planctomycetes bacterium]|nr:hypothetical protein [Planctomycetota bacterium]MCW8135439.1 hypothetical protein [Planctomycetota bacterium]
MKRLAPLLLLCLATLALAEDPRPAFPKVPAGMDDGRVTLAKESAEGLVPAEALPGRLFDEAGLAELAHFFHLHLTPDEKALVAQRLELGDELVRARDAASLLGAMEKKGLRPKQAAEALGRLFAQRKYTLTEALAWLNARGFNYRVLQSALNGERIDSFLLSRELRELAVAGKPAHQAFERGIWEFNLKDGRQENGGHYDGVQLVDALLALGWGEAEFAAARGLKQAGELSQTQRDLIAWGDPALIWPALERGMPESDLYKFALERSRNLSRSDEVLAIGGRRALTVRRFLRTGGAGVVGVYAGPWPDNQGSPRPPAANVRELADGDTAEVAAQLGAPIRAHFAHSGDTIVLVIYADGSGRALLRKAGRAPVNHGPASPAGNTSSADQLYEGRVSLKGRGALLYAVHAGAGTVAPTEFELVNLDLKASGALLAADIDDGTRLTPILLRRASRLMEAP